MRPICNAFVRISKETRRNMHEGEATVFNECEKRRGLPHGIMIGKLDGTIAIAPTTRSERASLGVAPRRRFEDEITTGIVDAFGVLA